MLIFVPVARIERCLPQCITVSQHKHVDKKKIQSLQQSWHDIAAAKAGVMFTPIVDCPSTQEQREVQMHSLHPAQHIRKLIPQLYKYWNARHQGETSCTDQQSLLSFARVPVAHPHVVPDSSGLYTRPRRLQRRKKQ